MSEEIYFLECYALRFDGYRFQETHKIENDISRMSQEVFEGKPFEPENRPPLVNLCLLFIIQRQLRHCHLPPEKLRNVHNVMRKIYLYTNELEIPEEFQTEDIGEWTELYGDRMDIFKAMIASNIQ